MATTLSITVALATTTLQAITTNQQQHQQRQQLQRCIPIYAKKEYLYKSTTAPHEKIKIPKFASEY